LAYIRPKFDFDDCHVSAVILEDYRLHLVIRRIKKIKSHGRFGLEPITPLDLQNPHQRS